MQIRSRTLARVTLLSLGAIFIGLTIFYLLQQRREALEAVPEQNSKNNGDRAEQFSETQIGASKLLSFTVTMKTLDLVKKNYPIAPEQYILNATSALNPNETYAISLGGPKRGIVFSDKTLALDVQKDQVVEKSLTVADLVSLLQEGDRVTIDLDFGPLTPDYATTVKEQLKQHQTNAEKSNQPIEPLEIQFFAVSKVTLEK